MTPEIYDALQRLIKEVKEKRAAKCLNIDCVVNHNIMGNDIDLVEGWANEVANEVDNERTSI